MKRSNIEREWNSIIYLPSRINKQINIKKCPFKLHPSSTLNSSAPLLVTAPLPGIVSFSLTPKFRGFFSFRLASIQPRCAHTLQTYFTSSKQTLFLLPISTTTTATSTLLADSTDNPHPLYRQCLALWFRKVSSPNQAGQESSFRSPG